MSDILTAMERRALLGTQALSREMHELHAQEHQRIAQQREEMQQDLLALLREIAVAHGLEETAFDGDYGISLSTMTIIATAPAEEVTPADEITLADFEDVVERTQDTVAALDRSVTALEAQAEGT